MAISVEERLAGGLAHVNYWRLALVSAPHAARCVAPGRRLPSGARRARGRVLERWSQLADE